MAARPALYVRGASLPVRSVWRCCRCSYATASQDAISLPPLLTKLRVDMKEALKVKDKPRLNVLRGILTETTALEKRSQSVKNDKQIYKIIEKQIKASTKAAEEFASAGREDLRDKEHGQISIMEEYKAAVKSVSEEEVVVAVQDAIQQLQTDGVTPKRERVRRLLFAKGGTLEDKVINGSEDIVAKTVHAMVHEVAPSKNKQQEKKDRVDHEK